MNVHRTKRADFVDENISFHEEDNNGTAGSGSRMDDVVDGNNILCPNADSVYDRRQQRIHPNEPQVPITLILIILTSYISIGTVIFSIWESWSMVDGAYFCFLTLSTIGFGDLVPKKTFYGPDIQIFACCVYLILGLVLTAMSFTLIETQLIWKCKRIAGRLKLSNDWSIIISYFILIWSTVKSNVIIFIKWGILQYIVCNRVIIIIVNFHKTCSQARKGWQCTTVFLTL